MFVNVDGGESNDLAYATTLFEFISDKSESGIFMST